MPPSTLAPSSKPLSARYLSFAEREELAILRAQGAGIRAIGRRLGRSGSTISRELRRNAATRGGGLEYRATTAQWHAERSARRPKPAKMAVNATLRVYVQERLAGTVAGPSGAAIPGPVISWKGRRHGPRKPRRWAAAWSPEQIARRLRLDFPDDGTMRISHEAIYQALYVQSRGALRRELTTCLRTGRALRVPRARSRGRGKSHVGPEVLISERPAEAGDRAVPGHWEGDLILGLGSSAIGTLVERTTRLTMLLHLPRMADHGCGPRVKNGPALAGHGAEAVRDAIARKITTLPELLRQSLTWDQGAEMAQHPQTDNRHRTSRLLLRSAQPLAARHEREHQRAATAVFPEGDRPVRAQRGRARCRGHGTQHQAAKDAWLANACRSVWPGATIGSAWCCDDWLNPSNTRRRSIASCWPHMA